MITAMPLRPAALGLSLLAALASPPPSSAACGAHLCPRVQDPGPVSTWQAGWSAHRLGFDLAGVAGAYSEVLLSARWSRTDRIVAAVHVPFLALETPQGDRNGFGNPMALAEYRWHPAPRFTLALGSQLEFPLGDHEHGLAQPHYMAVPYATGAFLSGAWSVSATAGASANFGGEHDPGAVSGAHSGHAAGAGTPQAVFVHPHEDLEAVWRLNAGAGASAAGARLEAFLGGQHVLAGSGDYLTAGFSVPVSTGRFEFAPGAELPISAARRFDWSLGLRCDVKL